MTTLGCTLAAGTRCPPTLGSAGLRTIVSNAPDSVVAKRAGGGVRVVLCRTVSYG